MNRICWISTGLNTGGAEKMLVKIIKNLDKKVFCSIVVSLIDEGTNGAELKGMGVPVYSLKMNTILGFLLSIFRIAFIVYQFRPNIIQGWMYHANLLAWFAQKIAAQKSKLYFGVRHTFYDYSLESKNTRIVIKLNGFLSKTVDGILFNSNLSLNKHKEIGFQNSRLIVIPNGFELDSFYPSIELRNKIRSELDIDKSCKVVGLVARFDPAKDHYTFLKAVRLITERININIKFVLVGRNITVSNQALIDWISELDISKNILLLGERVDIPAINNAFDIACLSSYMEAFPNVIGEAMACGIPCVATNVGDVEFIIGDSGLVVESRNAEALAAAIISLLNLSSIELKQLSMAARDRVVKNYEIKKIVQDYASFYLSI